MCLHLCMRVRRYMHKVRESHVSYVYVHIHATCLCICLCEHGCLLPSTRLTLTLTLALTHKLTLTLALALTRVPPSFTSPRAESCSNTTLGCAAAGGDGGVCAYVCIYVYVCVCRVCLYVRVVCVCLCVSHSVGDAALVISRLPRPIT